MVLLSLGRNNCLGSAKRLAAVKIWCYSFNQVSPGTTSYRMLSISVIIFFSVVLFAYWFRYSCLLILQSRVASDQSYALGSGLTFPTVQKRLKVDTGSLDLLDQLHRD